MVRCGTGLLIFKCWQLGWYRSRWDQGRAWQLEWPGNFFGGNPRDGSFVHSEIMQIAEQRRELEAIFTGKKGGLLAGLVGRRDQ